MKVIELAKQLKVEPRELIGFLRDLNIRVKSPKEKLSAQTVSQVKELFTGKDGETETLTNDDPIEMELDQEIITVNNLAKLLEVSLPEIMKIFLKKGLLVNLNSEIDSQIASDIATEFNIILKTPDKVATDTSIKAELDKIEEDNLENIDSFEERPPVVTIMGHVDHGKTLLLDTIRKSNVVDGEAGGITQHIGAYQVTVNDKKITFLDTPGHEAFTTLRARGAQVTDITILVVAADEGIKPQTLEAIDHAKAADVPIIVAINKIDKEGANIDNIKTQLSGHDLVAEDWGGKTVMVPISAKTGDGINDLLEMIALTSDMLELKTHFNGLAKGVVIESKLSKQKGPVATILVKSGTLKMGDHFVIGSVYGKIRAMFDDLGKPVTTAEPGSPVEILGISEVPNPGNILEVTVTEKEGKNLTQERQLEEKEQKSKQLNQISLETISKKIEEGEVHNINFIIKSDVNGSLEAIKASIEQISSEDIAISIIHAATGPVNENDIMLAKASGAIVVAFSVITSNEMEKLAEKEGITLKNYTIIYNIIEDIEKLIKGMYKPEYEEVETGRAEVRQIFKFSKVGSIAGSYVTSGKITRNNIAKLFRDQKEIISTTIDTLKRFQENVKDVQKGYECGIVLADYHSIQEGDEIITYELVEKKL